MLTSGISTPDKPRVGKDNTHNIASTHLQLRTRIERVVRRTSCCSKTDHQHDLVMGVFSSRYDFGRAL